MVPCQSRRDREENNARLMHYNVRGMHLDYVTVLCDCSSSKLLVLTLLYVLEYCQAAVLGPMT